MIVLRHLEVEDARCLGFLSFNLLKDSFAFVFPDILGDMSEAYDLNVFMDRLVLGWVKNKITLIY